MAQVSKREQLIQTALELFSLTGYSAVGVNTISEKAGITKKTLYHHFKSKEEPILAVRRYYEERIRNSCMRAVEAKTDIPQVRLLIVCGVYGDLWNRRDLSGCL
ncbi:MAG: TetR/AcrR family transcriptional regulator, partial [Nitrospinae bacterium]|nr:TetR/AcrR family transcriptional regulator [Nitrospinota bacterium]